MKRSLSSRYGQWAMVAGASQGFGESFAVELAKRGMNVVLVARQGDLLEKLAHRLRAEHGVEVRCLVFDLAEPDFAEAIRNAVADLANPNSPAWLLAVAALVFIAGWTLSRGSNMQKYSFKRDPEKVFLGRLAPRAFSDGERRVLYSGFWGVSRHVNYLGELLMACGLVLSLGWLLEPGPWFYPLYYVALLLPRERDDDRRCAEKYGQLWEQYRRKVPWRIVPRVY